MEQKRLAELQAQYRVACANHEKLMLENIEKSNQTLKDFLITLERKSEKLAEQVLNKNYKSLSHLSKTERQFEISLARDVIINYIDLTISKV
jgi:hypothetical protein